MASSILQQFRAELDRRCVVAGLSCDTWSDVSPTRENLILIKGRESSLLYVKESGGDRGFWGATANRIKTLCASGLRWHLVLLAGRASVAHVLADHQVMDRIETGYWKLGHDGDYKVNEGPRLPVEARLETFDQIFGVLL